MELLMSGSGVTIGETHKVNLAERGASKKRSAEARIERPCYAGSVSSRVRIVN